MPEKLLDGTNASADLTIQDLDATGTVTGTATSIKCIIGDMSIQHTQQTIQKGTFCSSSWMKNSPGFRQGALTASGYASSGQKYSDPLALINKPRASRYIATFDTGCTEQFDAVTTLDSIGIGAFRNSDRNMAAVFDGAPSSTWVIT